MKTYSVCIFAWCDRLQDIYTITTDDPDGDIRKLLDTYSKEWNDARVHVATDNKGNSRHYKTIRNK